MLFAIKEYIAKDNAVQAKITDTNATPYNCAKKSECSQCDNREMIEPIAINIEISTNLFIIFLAHSDIRPTTYPLLT